MQAGALTPTKEADSSFFQGLDEYDLRADAVRTFDQLKALDLVENAAELDIKGLTVIAPEKVGPPEVTARLREAVLDVTGRRDGVRPDPSGLVKVADMPNVPFGRNVSYLLFEDPVFQEFLLNPALVAIGDYMLGRNFCISSFQALLKAKGGSDLSLHTDELLVPPPYSSHAGGINVTYMLTDYTIEGGALLYVPGSHKTRRQPIGNEGLKQMEPVTGPAGSLVIWNGGTWHGAHSRKIDGLRMNLVLYLMRPHMRPHEPYRENVTPEILRNNPARLRTMLGLDLSFGWKEEGPQPDGSDTLIGTSAFC